MADGEFAGKVAVVTGAGSGLGRAAALAFAGEGAALALVDIDEAGLEETVAALPSRHGGVLSLARDLGDPDACGDLVRQAAARFGRIDALCNIAGLFGFAPAAAIEASAWDRMFAVNVRAPFLTMQAALPHLIESRGAVVNVASASAFLGHAYLAHYAASKAALVNLTKSLAMEYMHEPVRINALAPGGIDTAMTRAPRIPEGIDFSLLGRYAPMRGSSQPEDLTDAILMLAGPRGQAFHGACLNADRGITAG